MFQNKKRVALSEYLSTDNKSGQKIRETNIKKHKPIIYDEIINHNTKRFDNIGWKQKVYNYLNNVTENPKCKNPSCNGYVNFYNQDNKYLTYCCNRCAQTSPEIMEKKRNTTKKNYGVESPMQSNVVKEKAKKTTLKIYGVDNVSKSSEILEKKKKTSLKRYGVDNHSKTNKFRVFMKDKHKKNVLLSFSKKLNIDVGNLDLLTDELVVVRNYCNLHDEFFIYKDNVYGRVNGGHENICTICNPISYNISIKEKEINEFITKTLNVETERRKIDNYEIDIFSPRYNIGIEHNGIYWHSDVFKTNDYHKNKTELCEKNNIKLLQIFEDEWINKKDIVKSIIQKKFKMYEKEISADCCEIKKPTNKEYCDFLNKNNIFGYIQSKIKYGLYYDNEIVSVISFKKIKNNFEVLRFCSKLNLNIDNAFNILLGYFIKKNKPQKITTLIDRGYFSGTTFLSAGFNIVGYTEPEYYYSHKRNFDKYTKDMLYQGEEINDALMKINGYYKVYDCGKIILELNL